MAVPHYVKQWCASALAAVGVIALLISLMRHQPASTAAPDRDDATLPQNQKIAPGTRVYASSDGRPQPNPITDPDEAKRYVDAVARKYTKFWDVPEADRALFDGLAGGQGDVLFYARRRALVPGAAIPTNERPNLATLIGASGRTDPGRPDAPQPTQR